MIEAGDELRCSACGARVEDPIDWAEGPDATRVHANCPRPDAGRMVVVKPGRCAVEGCALSRRGTVLKSATHFAEHMGWHHQQWDAEEAAARAPAAAPPAAAPAPAAPARAYDYWAPTLDEVQPADRVKIVLMPPEGQPDAQCVGLLVHAWAVDCFVAECEPLGGPAPVAAYVLHEGRAPAAFVPIPPTAGPLVMYLQNDGGVPIKPRVAGRWEHSKA